MLDGSNRSGLEAGRRRGAAVRGRGITRREFVRRAAGTAVLAGLGSGALAACGGTQERGGAQGAGGGPVEIEYWHINTETFGLDAVRDLVGQFNEENPGIRVRESFHGSDAYSSLLEDLQTAQAAGRSPDVAQIGYDSHAYVATNFEFSSAEELAAEYGPEDFFAGFPERLLDLGKVEGVQAGVPHSLSTAIVYCNADLLAKAGVDTSDLPRDWQAWERALEGIRQELDMPGLAFDVYPGVTWYPQMMIECNGGRVLGCQEEQTAAAFGGPEAVEAIRFWAEMVDRALVLDVVGDQAEQAFLSGELPAYINSTSGIYSAQEQADFDLRGAPFPSFGGKELRIPGGGNSLFVFSGEDSEREAAWRFVRFLSSASGQREWSEATGLFPTRDDVSFGGDDPMRAIASEQIPRTVPWVSFPGPNGFQAAQVFSDAAQEAIGGQGDVAAILQGAATEVDGLIEGQPCL